MYKKNQNRQITLKDFNQPLGLKLNPENKWIKKAAMIPWEAIEKNTLIYSHQVVGCRQSL